MPILKSHQFWIGFLIGYFLVVLVPAASFKNVKSGKGPGGI